MVGRFLRLRLALFRAGFRTGNLGTTIATVLGLVWSLVGGVAGLAGGVALRWLSPDVVGIVVPVALAVVYLVWLIGPITVAGSDAAMDPVKFVLLPLRRRDLAAGLAAAGLAGPGGIATTLLMLGLVIGLAPAGPGVLAVAAGAVLYLGLCILSSRFLGSLVGMGLRRRGVRDVLAVAIPLVVIIVAQLPNILQNVARAAGPEAAAAMWRTLRVALRFFPSSLPAEAMLAGYRGDLVRPLPELAGGLVFCLLLGWGWSWLLGRAMTTPPGLEGEAKARRRGSFRTSRLFPWLSARAGAVSDKDLILLFREPAQRVQLIMAVILTLGAVIVPAIFTREPWIGFVAIGPGLFFGIFNSNMYGYDGSSTWVNVAAGDDARADLLGKVVARLLVFTPLAAAAAIGLGIVTGPSLLPVTFGTAVGTWFLTMGLATLQSVLTPYPVVYSADTLMPRNQGTFQAAIAQFVTFPAIAVLIGPFVVAAVLLEWSPLLVWGLGIGALAVGAGALYGSYRIAVAYSAPRQPELLEQVSKRAEA